MRVPREGHDLSWLRKALQAAVELELSTIPPYLFAMWSIDATVSPVTDLILNIVLEEMGHMGLACNMLTAGGGGARHQHPDRGPDISREPSGRSPALGPNSTATVSRPSVPDDPVVVLCLLAHPSVPRAGTTPWRARQAHPSVGLSQGLLLRGPRPHHVSTFPRPKLR
jgi:hypothetical protein